MIRYAIIEDEPFARREMERMMADLRPDYKREAWAESVEGALSLLRQTLPDLLIVDICLSDGLCFDVFERLPVNVPVIFTTAYDDYAMQAFRVNSIDYLLKPVEEKDLERALRKFETNCLHSPTSGAYKALEAAYMGHAKKHRFLVSAGDTYRSVDTADIAFFYSEDKCVYLHTFAGRRYVVNYSLDHLSRMLDENDFFRVSRNCIAHIRSIQKVNKYFAGRLRVSFCPPCPQEVVISRSRATDFLRWMDGAQ